MENERDKRYGKIPPHIYNFFTRDDRLGIQSTYYRQGIADLLQISIRLLPLVIPPLR